MSIIKALYHNNDFCIAYDVTKITKENATLKMVTPLPRRLNGMGVVLMVEWEAKIASEDIM